MNENLISITPQETKKEKRHCAVCGKILKRQQKLFCSKVCSLTEKAKNILFEKRKQTCLERYGVENPNQSEEIKEKKKQTCQERYGGNSPFNSNKVKEKYKQTCLELYGVENPSQNEKVKEKRKQTCLERYGCVCSAQNEEVKEKYKQTCLERYGVDNVAKTIESKIKYKQTCLERYGVTSSNQDACVKEKKKIANNKKYGVDYPTQLKQIMDQTIQTKRKYKFNFFKENLKMKFIEPLFTEDEYIHALRDDILEFKCLRCGKIFKYKIDKYTIAIQHISCPDQSHKSSSKAEQEIYDWLVSIGITNIERNKRNWGNIKTVEADLYLPDYKLVIEYNGLYWHSNLNKDKNYHLNKWKFFKNLDIDCIQIFENEWKEKKEIVKSIILNKFGKCKKIYARKCTIKEIPCVEYELFLEQNHIQGYHQAKVRLGLYLENELVELMSFSKPRFNKKYDWENIRTCTKVGYHVIGGFSKLLNYFKKIYSGSIISYIDSRYFSGNGYIINGFQNINHSNPNYSYFKIGYHNLHNRIEFQKHKLKNKLELYDKNLTEKENMSLNDYLWIYDCGNEVFVKKYQ